MHNKNYKVGVVIVGYNSLNYLKDCLTSLDHSSYGNTVYYVDNSSNNDGSIDYIKKHHPTTVVIENINTGYAGGNNVGIKAAIKDGCDYLLILNPDTILEKKCLEKLINEGDENTIQQPLLLMYDQEKTQKTQVVNSAGNIVNILGFSYCGNYKAPASNYGEIADISTASGAAVLFPTRIIKKIGVYDETFFMYHEDVDIAWRSRLAGYNIVVNPHAVVWHKYSFSRDKKKFYFAERNRLMFVTKCFELKTILLLLPISLISEIAMCVLALIQGWLIIKLKSYFSYFKLLPQTLKSRQTIQKKRSISDHQLRRYLSPSIGFSEVDIPALKIYNLLNRGYWFLVKWII